MTRDRYTHLQRRLEEERATLRAEIEALEEGNLAPSEDTGASNHFADGASEVFTRERNIALRNNAEDLLQQVETALRRLDEGTYGTCARCGNPIAAERLEALPYAAYCITCQAVVEQER